ncbi:MAG: CBS domain-containing protein [candidate division Zixibacteria bacterium]|nr:CBS domain-containing protein [candidate division Zixibacteria bacterium]
MLVNDVLSSKSRRLITVTADTSVTRAMTLLLEHRISCLPVVDAQGRLVGIVSDKDIFKLVHEHPDDFKQRPIGDIMTVHLFTSRPSEDLIGIAGLMTTRRIRHVPVLDQGRLVGLISIGDVVKAQLDEVVSENEYLRKYISGDYPA